MPVSSAAGGEICHRAEFCHWSFYVTAIGRTTTGINKAEDGMAHVQISPTDALRRIFPTALASYSNFVTGSAKRLC